MSNRKNRYPVPVRPWFAVWPLLTRVEVLARGRAAIFWENEIAKGSLTNSTIDLKLKGRRKTNGREKFF
jgi:hypothetical protein